MEPAWKTLHSRSRRFRISGMLMLPSTVAISTMRQDRSILRSSGVSRRNFLGAPTMSRAGFEEGGSEPEQFIPAGNKIVVFVHARVRPKGSKEWQDFRLADVYTIRDGKAIEMRAFSDRQEALRW